MDKANSINNFLLKKENITTSSYKKEIFPTKVKPFFKSGFFTVGETGKVSFEFLYYSGGYKVELAIFSLNRMEEYEVGSHKFILEAVSRASSDSKLGHIVIKDRSQKQNFSNHLGNLTTISSEDRSPTDTFIMNPGDTFAMMLIPQGTLEQVFNRLKITERSLPPHLNPLFSFTTDNFQPSLSLGEIVDVGGEEVTFILENLAPQEFANKDCNDIIFRVKGAKGQAISLDEEAKPTTNLELGWHGDDFFNDLVQKHLTLPIESETGVKYQPGELLVKFAPNFKEEQIHCLASTYGAKQVESILPFTPKSNSPLQQWRLMTFSRHVNLLAIRDRLDQETSVEATELNIVSFSGEKEMMP